MEEKDIIGLLMNRKEEAIEELGAKYGKLCGQLAFRVLNNEQDVQECVNDTYFAVWENIPPDCPSHLTAYVCKIARRIAINRFKHNTRKKRCAKMDALLCELEDCIPSGQNVETQWDERQLVTLINGWLQKLDEKTQALFVRRYFFLQPIDELATAFSISQSNVSTQLYRARKNLKEYLSKEGYEL